MKKFKYRKKVFYFDVEHFKIYSADQVKQKNDTD